MKDIKKCPCQGVNLDKLIQPATLTLLATEELHGYYIVQKLQNSCILQGQKPDPSGVYRCLRLQEQRGLVNATWNVADPGPAKRLYKITDSGLECLQNWLNTLEIYQHSLGGFIISVKTAIQASNMMDYENRGCCSGKNYDTYAK